MAFSGKVAAQDQCSPGGWATTVISLATANLAETGTAVEPAGGLVVFIHFKKDGAAAVSRQTPQLKIEQAAGKPPPALGRSNGDGEDFRFARHESRENEAAQ